jgi:hypothetical protein
VAAADTFKIPAARDTSGRLVVPEEARKRALYRCPQCDARVDLHAGEKKRRHFHHRAGACTSESVLHLCAKQLIAQAVDEWLDGGPPVTFVRRCAHESCDARSRQAIPKKVAGVALEHVLPSGHVVDVALLAGARARAGAAARFLPLPVAAIEVHHTHAVDDAKAFEMGIPWIEVEAADACASAGRELVAVRDRFLPWLCNEHEAQRGVGRRAERDERTTAAALTRKLPFRLAEYPGFRIARVARCNEGHDALVFAWDGKDPPWPRPPLVVAVEKDAGWSFGRVRGKPSKTLPWRRAYTSVCAVCAAPLDEPQARE